MYDNLHVSMPQFEIRVTGLLSNSMWSAHFETQSGLPQSIFQLLSILVSALVEVFANVLYAKEHADQPNFHANHASQATISAYYIYIPN